MERTGAKRKAYLVLLGTQIAGAALLTWVELPEFRRLLNHLGEQLRTPIKDDLLSLFAVVIMQGAYWSRLLRVPLISFRRAHSFFNHLFQFLSRISFIFGSSVFSVVFFRHVPELGLDVDMPLLLFRAIVLIGSLFALFCLSLEFDRLANALAAPVDRNDSPDSPRSDV